MCAGYSPTPLAKKLGVKEGHRLVLLHAAPGWTIGELPAKTVVSRRRSVSRADTVLAFFTRLATLQSELDAISRLITANGSIWLAWPRRAGGHASDITDNDVRSAALKLGLVDVKVAALDDDWSSLKVVWRKELRSGLVASDD
jgi:hypothetical protein